MLRFFVSSFVYYVFSVFSLLHLQMQRITREFTNEIETEILLKTNVHINR